MNNSRWTLESVNHKEHTFCVIDCLANKLRTFHIPHLEHVDVIGDKVYITTLLAKVMSLCLHTNSRKFLSVNEISALKLPYKQVTIMHL